MALAPGTRLGAYEILSPLGAGGMGEVYKGRDTRLNRTVAVKVLPAHLSDDSEALDRFRREAMAVAALAHPNILVLHDVGSEGGVHYLVTELLEGETLRERLSRGPLPWRRAAQVGAAIAQGLAAGHSKGIVHRDIKPGNIWLTPDGRVKILDFGLAQTAGALSEIDESATVTSAGRTVVGTVGYMSPEQIRGEHVGPAGDLFSLGAVLYEMVTGRRAFLGQSPTDTIAAILKEDPPSASASGISTSPELDRIIERCLAKTPGERFQSAHDLAFALTSLSSSAGEAFPATAAARPTRGAVAAAIAALVVILVGVGFFAWRNGTGRTINSLAVLPFLNAGGGDNADWLSDGLTDSLIDSLVQVPGLKVMSHNSVFRFKGKDSDARDVARQLGVSAVLSGRIVEHAGQLSVNAELVDARDGSVLWGEHYERSMSEILTVQQDITSRISDTLRLKLTGAEKQKLASQGTGNPEAYQLYLKGKYFAGKFTKEGFDKGLDYLRQAVTVDPTYARAYEGISYAYQIADDALLPPHEVCPKSIEAAKKAIALDDSLSEGHSDLAGMYFWYDYDWTGAKREFERALQLNPKSSFAHEMYGWMLTTLGDSTNGIAEGRKALEIDPLSVEAGFVLAQDLYLSRRYSEASDVLRKLIDQDPSYPPAYWGLGMIDLAQGKPAEAVAALEKGRQVGPMDWITEVLAAAYAADGNRSAARKILNELDDRSSRGGYVSNYCLAYAYLALGDRDRALSALERDFDQRSPNMTYIKLDPGLDRLHDEPRYQALVRKMKLE